MAESKERVGLHDRSSMIDPEVVDKCVCHLSQYKIAPHCCRDLGICISILPRPFTMIQPKPNASSVSMTS